MCVCVCVCVCVPQSMEGEVSIPRSIPGLVTKGLLVMTYLEGTPITRMQVRAAPCCIAAFRLLV